MTLYFLILVMFHDGVPSAVVVPQQYTLEDCITSGREARRKEAAEFLCVKVP